MELRQLKYFVTTADTLNFSDAARMLNVAQSTLSQQIRQLEDELGVRLFERNTHSMSLTEAGREVLPAARRTILDADQCADRIRDLRGLATGTLSIGVTYSFSPILTEALLSFMKLYPAIKLNIFYKPMAELMELLTKREVDFVLAYKPLQPIEGVESHILFQDSLAAVVGVSHPLAKCTKVSLDTLAQYRLALPTRGLQARNAFDAICGPRNRYDIRIEINDVNILLKLVRQTSLVTVLAQDSVYGESEVKAIPLDVPANEMDGCVHILKDCYHKRSVKEFLRLLNESLAVKERQFSWIM